MIRDFAQYADAATLSADVCIVGAGAAGLALAKEFAATSREVLLLESGGWEAEPATQELYRSEIVGLPHAGIHEGRVRVFGGTTTLWGGQTVRFSEFDLQPRSWVPHSGWPISYRDLEPYYQRADRLLRLGPSIGYADLCASFGVDPPAFDPSELRMDCSLWSPKPNLAKEWRAELHRAPNVVALLHANVTSIVTNRSGNAVEGIEFQTLEGKTGTARARCYVICCGGIETARLLLASDRLQPNGLGNDRDLVGRFFQEHIHYSFGMLETRDRRRLQDCFESFYRRSLKYFPVVALSEQAQRQRQLLSAHGAVAFDSETLFALKQLYRLVVLRTGDADQEYARLLRGGWTGPRDLLHVAYRFYVKKRAGTARQGAIGIGAQVECAPHPESRVSLGESRDRLGMRQVRLDWRLTELERRTLRQYIGIFAAEFERLGLGTFDLRQQEILDRAEGWAAQVHDSAHHMGTTRMSDTPAEGVVDRDCRVHGIDNLYIGSSAVFPTSGRANPTLTIMALCLRLADRLKALL